jgi:hypothetical protein
MSTREFKEKYTYLSQAASIFRDVASMLTGTLIYLLGGLKTGSKSQMVIYKRKGPTRCICLN